MATATLTQTDLAVKDAVARQLEWDPDVDASEIGVTAKSGAVVLTGLIGSYAGKLAAERAAKRVRGVRVVANEIEVRLRLARPDADIAVDVVRALQMRSTIPAGVQGSVHRGHVILTGKVTHVSQSREAEEAVRHIRGVCHVENHLTVAARAIEHDVHHRIVAALHRNADIDARHITITISAGKVVMTGQVRIWLQREAAERAAADAPGIIEVENRIVVEPRQLDAVPDEEC